MTFEEMKSVLEKRHASHNERAFDLANQIAELQRQLAAETNLGNEVLWMIGQLADPPKAEAPAKPRADVRALTLARFTEGREIASVTAHVLIAHEIGRKPSEVRRALARLAATGQLTLSHEGFYRRAEQRSVAA